MNQRSLLIVAAAAVVFVILALLGQNRPDSSSAAGALLLPGLADALNDVDEISLVKAGSETIARLQRGAGGWTVAEKDDYPADVVAIRQALLAISEARIAETKTANPEFYDRLGVTAVDQPDSAGTAVTIATASERFPTVIFGSSEGDTYRYARLADAAESVLLNRNPELPREAAQWVQAAILDIRGDRVQAVTIEHADGERLSISKIERSQTNFSVEPIAEGRRLQYPGVANVIGNALRELTLEDVRRDQASDGDVAVTTEFRTFDGLVVTARGIELDDAAWLRFEARFDAQQAVEFATEPVDGIAETQDDDGDGDPRRQAEAINAAVSGWLFRIPSFKYDQITRRVEDLLQAPE